MISVEEALGRILKAFSPLAAERVSLASALGRVLAEDVTARLTQPPTAVSAMDGYAVRASDAARVPATLRVVGSAPAGGAYGGTLRTGEAVRIFTGAPLPAGADAVVIQEDTTAEGDRVTIREGARLGRHIRPAGLDFKAGEVGICAGRRLGPRQIGLAAAMNVPWLSVRRRPRVAVLATGDEIVMPGDPLGPNQIVSSNALALTAAITAWGGEPINLGIAADTKESLQGLAAGAAGADLLITTGGASVGEHDLVQSALAERGLAVDFWQIAMRPGKPLIFGRLGTTPLLGLPGNPVSSLVCAIIFLRPAMARMLGLGTSEEGFAKARLGCDLAANDRRQDYLRARLARAPDGEMVATPFEVQDSSNLSRLAHADCLVVRPPFAPSAKAGDGVTIIPLDGLASVI
ncbi:MAG TPA: gephyrin-like molybdotransferase Glp [Alphaproteobacteria bacterium]|nr:gephyrin-like molybdotransferase Glp [Alphaproteobacteria bacterium]